MKVENDAVASRSAFKILRHRWQPELRPGPRWGFTTLPQTSSRTGEGKGEVGREREGAKKEEASLHWHMAEGRKDVNKRDQSESANPRQGKNVMEDNFFAGERIVSWFDLETCFKVTKNGQNTCDFLLVLQ